MHRDGYQVTQTDYLSFTIEKSDVDQLMAVAANPPMRKYVVYKSRDIEGQLYTNESREHDQARDYQRGAAGAGRVN
jgi:hypothetical protein